MNIRTAVPALIALLAPVAAHAAPPLIPVTGYLTDDNGVPIDGTVDIDFKIYRATGPAQWSNGNQPISVDVFDGQFTAYLGSDAPLDLQLFRDNTNLYLGMSVDSAPEMQPRFEIGSAPFAGYAKYCDEAYSVGGADVTQLRMAADDILWSELSTSTIPSGLDDGDDVGPTYTAGTGIGISNGVISASMTQVQDWARVVAYDTQTELTGQLDTIYLRKQSCAANQLLVADGGGNWSCTDSTALPLSEAVIDGFVSNNGYATGAALTALTGRVATAESSITTLTSQMATANTNITSVTGRVTTAEGSIGTLTTQMGTANTNITTLQGQIGGLGTNPGNMIGQYEFDEGTGATSFADTSGLSNTLAASVGGVSPNSGTAHSGRSVGFNTVEGIYAASGNKIADSDQIWAEMWINTGNPGGTYTLLEKQGAYKLRLVANNLIWTVTTTGGTCTVTHSLPVSANTWTLVSGWFDGLNSAVAINGSAASTACSSGRIAPTFGGVMTIGGIRTGTSWTEVFSGFIDEVRIRPTAPNSGQAYNYRTSGGVITEVANKRIHVFKESGSFTTYVPLVVDVLVVGGGGAGGQHTTTNGNGGGGAGGYIYQTNYTVAPGTYTVTVGAGGGAADYMSWNTISKVGNNGGNSIFSTLTAIGGGGGGAQSTGNGLSGGSGGGGASNGNPTPGNGTPGQGNIGGQGNYTWTGGGGGGAGGPGIAGGVCGNCAPSGNGGQGLSNSITGTLMWYAGGGGGGGNSSERAGDGYHGGGRGYGTTSQYNYQYQPKEINPVTLGSGTVDAIPNTGGGGGAGSYWNSNKAGNGGSGIVVIRYPI